MQRKDDTRDEAMDVLGGLRLVSRDLARLNGWGSTQRAALATAMDRLDDARSLLIEFIADRDRMGEALQVLDAK